MGDGGHVFDQGDLKPCGLQRADGGFSSLAGALNENLNGLHAVLHSELRGGFGSSLRGKRRALSGTAEPISPALAHETVLPCVSEIVTMVLLKVD